MDFAKLKLALIAAAPQLEGLTDEEIANKFNEPVSVNGPIDLEEAKQWFRDNKLVSEIDTLDAFAVDGRVDSAQKELQDHIKKLVRGNAVAFGRFMSLGLHEVRGYVAFDRKPLDDVDIKTAREFKP